MIAMLRGACSEAIGKLVLVRHPVGPITPRGYTGMPLFSWRVFMLSGPVTLNGKSSCDWVMPDICLKPVSQIEPKWVDKLYKARAMAEFHEALADLRRYLAVHPMSEKELDAAVERAAVCSLIERALEVVPMPTALGELGFTTLHGSEYGAWRWSAVHEGAQLVVNAGPDMFGTRWSIVGRCVTTREAMWDERYVLAEEARGKVALLVLDLWRSAFGRTAPVPEAFGLAQRYEQHRADIGRVGLGPPKLLVDGEILRMTKRLMTRRHGLPPVTIGPLPDARLALSHRDGLLRLEIGAEVYAIPAQGVWIEDCTVSLREFLAMPAQHLRGHRFDVIRSANAISFGGNELPVDRASTPT